MGGVAFPRAVRLQNGNRRERRRFNRSWEVHLFVRTNGRSVDGAQLEAEFVISRRRYGPDGYAQALADAMWTGLVTFDGSTYRSPM